MKRALLIATALVVFAVGADARDYTNLDPPTLAVADFEVSMSASTIKDTGRDFYGELISQALLSVLIQQNAASVVYAPRDDKVIPGVPVYDPAMTTVAGRLAAADKDANTAAAVAIDKAVKDYTQAKDDAGRSRAVDAAVQAAGNLAAYATGLEKIAAIGDRQIARLYFPSIFKIFDKKYVENALQSGTFTVNDLYTKAVGAFKFTDLDFLVLGNVYETRYGTDKDSSPAIGFNVRVLNTKRAEETYSYSAVVRSDLHDLPIACAEICQRIMIDILNSHCAQFTITESPDVSEVAVASTNVDSTQTTAAAKAYEYYLFWQPRQVEKDDNTVGDSDDSSKRFVSTNVFYWTLPGQYVISVYNRKTQQLKTVPFSIAAGAIQNVVIQKQHLDTPKGTITIGGIGPTTSYVFEATPKKQSKQYWWEIFEPPMQQDPITIKLENGVITEKPDKIPVEYRPATQDILISNVPLALYDVKVTRNPPEGLSGITGVWYTSTKLTLTSKPLTVSVMDSKVVQLQIADFGLQEKQQIDSPRTTKVTFILNPGFGYDGYIWVDDQAPTFDELYWADKEKITITCEYTQADWESRPEVTYTIWQKGRYVLSKDLFRYQADDIPVSWWDSVEFNFQKSQIVSEKDIIVFLDIAAVRATADQRAKTKADGYEIQLKNQEALRDGQAALSGQAPQTTQTGLTVKAAQTAKAAPLAPAKTAPTPAAAAPAMLFKVGGGAGLASYDVYNSVTHAYTTSTGAAVTANAQLYWQLSSTLGLGVGGIFDLVLAGSPLFGAAGTVGMILGDFARGGMAYIVDAGIGNGITSGVGLVFPNAKKNGSLSVGMDYFLFNSGDWSLSLSIGALF